MAIKVSEARQQRAARVADLRQRRMLSIEQAMDEAIVGCLDGLAPGVDVAYHLAGMGSRALGPDEIETLRARYRAAGWVLEVGGDHYRQRLTVHEILICPTADLQ